ncbi:MAG: radical SAM protein [Candidatus Cloacimonetes bacterium]|nr:radical SAM protein [Candidatus Cloacimonadota bacterium]
MNLSEIFLSIQGESSYVGFPCIFIRLSGCNLRCEYCDTKYSYKTEFSLSAEEVGEKIRKFFPIKLVEITGGEPLLQEETYHLFELLFLEGYEILLETNGSVLLEKVPVFVSKIVDVKCPSSGFQGSFLLENLKFISKTDELKFVISDFEDYRWAKEFVENNELFQNNILFSPVSDELLPDKLAEWIIKDRFDVRLQLQLHKYIWNPVKRGV